MPVSFKRGHNAFLSPPELMVLESQVIRGSLAGVGPVDGGQWSGSAAEFLETAVADKLLLMVVVADLCQHLFLFDFSSDSYYFF